MKIWQNNWIVYYLQLSEIKILFYRARVYMFNQEELTKEFLITINYVSLLFVFHVFSLFRMKVALTYLNHDNYRVIMQNCSTYCCAKLCTNKFIFLFHVHLWYDGHFTSISARGVWGARARIQVSWRELVTKF